MILKNSMPGRKSGRAVPASSSCYYGSEAAQCGLVASNGMCMDDPEIIKVSGICEKPEADRVRFLRCGCDAPKLKALCEDIEGMPVYYDGNGRGHQDEYDGELFPLLFAAPAIKAAGAKLLMSKDGRAAIGSAAKTVGGGLKSFGGKIGGIFGKKKEAPAADAAAANAAKYYGMYYDDSDSDSDSDSEQYYYDGNDSCPDNQIRECGFGFERDQCECKVPTHKKVVPAAGIRYYDGDIILFGDYYGKIRKRNAELRKCAPLFDRSGSHRVPIKGLGNAVKRFWYSCPKEGEDWTNNYN